jgi:ubiquinone/menaquinone biosynthesis C-methylase UbiE
VSDHFSRVAAAYATFRPHYPDELFITLAQFSPGRRRVWDCATGSGQAAIGLAATFDQVVASDASAAQIRQATAHPRVTYHVAAAEAPALATASVELITVAQALHWFDLDRFYREADRVLVPGGVLAVWTYARLLVDGGPIDAVLDKFYIHTVGPYWPEERRLVETGYRDLPFPFEEISVTSPPMVASWTLSRMIGYVRTWSAVQRYVEAEGIDPVVALERQLARHWRDPELPRQIQWPLSVRAGRPPSKARSRPAASGDQIESR